MIIIQRSLLVGEPAKAPFRGNANHHFSGGFDLPMPSNYANVQQPLYFGDYNYPTSIILKTDIEFDSHF